MRRLTAAVAFAMIFSAGAVAQESVRAGDLVIEQPWARATIGTVRPGVAYLTIRNEGALPDRLLAIASEYAGSAEVHDTTTDASGVTRMGPTGPLAIGPGEEIVLAPGGKHLMLMQLNEPLVEGTRLPLTLHFEEAGKVAVDAPVLGLGSSGPDQE